MSERPPRYAKPGEAERLYGVDRRTLKRWADCGSIRSIQPGGVGQRLYDVSAVTVASDVPAVGPAVTEQEQEPVERTDAIYARVSTRKQSDDLARQVARLREQHPAAVVFTDVASGINFKRKGLLSLLQLATQGRVRHVHIAHKDRLCRFAYDLVEYVLKQNGAKIVVDAPDSHATSDEQELANDLVSIVTVFGARLYGRRSALGRKRKRDRFRSSEAQAPEEDVEVWAGTGKAATASPQSDSDSSAGIHGQ